MCFYYSARKMAEEGREHMALLRLDRIIVSMGSYSRKEVRQLVKNGRIRVNERIAAASDEKYDPETVRIFLDGEPLLYRRYIYIMMHKPSGILSATEDGRSETVLDRLPQPLKKQGLFPVGRLDKDTEGLLLLTNDGALAHRLLAPRSHVNKVYYAKVEGTLTEEDAQRFAKGMLLPDGLQCMPAQLQILNDGKEALVTVQEGKFHQVKRMLAACGKPVCCLKRLSMGPLQLDSTLERGQWRYLTSDEEQQLEKAGECGSLVQK